MAAVTKEKDELTKKHEDLTELLQKQKEEMSAEIEEKTTSWITALTEKGEVA